MAWVNWESEISNLIYRKWAEKSRYQKNLLHVSDVVGCHIQLFLSRISAAAGLPAHLARMRRGVMWEEMFAPEFIRREFSHEHKFEGIIEMGRPPRPPGPGAPRKYIEDVERSYVILATPDFSAKATGYDTIIELKTTSYTHDQTINIVNAQMNTLQQVGSPLPVEYNPNDYTVYMNTMMQISAYYEAALKNYDAIRAERRAENRRTRKRIEEKGYAERGEVIEQNPSRTRDMTVECIYMFSDRVQRFVLDNDILRRYYAEIFLPRITTAMAAVTTANAQTFTKPRKWHEERGRIFPSVHDMVTRLWLKEMLGSGILGYIGCDSCPYYNLGTCPTLPVLRTPRMTDRDKADHMQRWLVSYFVTTFNKTPEHIPLPTVNWRDPRASKRSYLTFIENMRRVYGALLADPDCEELIIHDVPFSINWLKDEDRVYTKPGMPGWDCSISDGGNNDKEYYQCNQCNYHCRLVMDSPTLPGAAINRYCLIGNDDLVKWIKMEDLIPFDSTTERYTCKDCPRYCRLLALKPFRTIPSMPISYCPINQRKVNWNKTWDASARSDATIGLPEPRLVESRPPSEKLNEYSLNEYIKGAKQRVKYLEEMKRNLR